MVGLTKHSMKLLMDWVRLHVVRHEWMQALRNAGVGNQAGAGKRLSTTKGLTKVFRQWIDMYNSRHDVSSRIGYVQVETASVVESQDELDAGRDGSSSESEDVSTIKQKVQEHLDLINRDLCWLDVVVSSHTRDSIIQCYHNLETDGHEVVNTLAKKVRTLFALQPEHFEIWFQQLESHMQGGVCFLLTQHYYFQDKRMYQELTQVAYAAHAMLDTSTRVFTSRVRALEEHTSSTYEHMNNKQITHMNTCITNKLHI